jgi:hypothetical protein
MVDTVSAPPLRLAEGEEDLVLDHRQTAAALLFGDAGQDTPESYPPGLADNLAYQIVSGARPIHGRQYFQKPFLASKIKGTPVDVIPDAWAGFINVAVLSCATAGTVAQPLGAFHRADEGRLL